MSIKLGELMVENLKLKLKGGMSLKFPDGEENWIEKIEGDKVTIMVMDNKTFLGKQIVMTKEEAEKLIQ